MRKPISLTWSLVPVAVLIGALYYAVQIAGLEVHIPIFGTGILAGIIAMWVGGIPWAELEEGVIDTIKMSMGAILILLVIGMLIGTWIISGVVPAMIFYGLKIIAPSVFLPVTMIICSIVSIATGSSWSTASTVGIALVGIGEGVGIPRPVIAGAIISGAYFGDKLSPMSDTTNLAPAMAGTTLGEHIKHMLWTTIPAYVISITIFGFMGMKYAHSALDMHNIDLILENLTKDFVISPWLLLVPLAVIGLVVCKVPALPGLFAGAVLGGVVAVAVQGKTVAQALKSFHYGYESQTGLKMVDELLSRGGMDSMLWTVSLIICAMIFGGIMEKSGMLSAIAQAILSFANTTGKLIAATIFTPIFMNIITGEQYLSIVIPGRMFKESYIKKGLAPQNLSRALEDSGTLTSPLIPWNTCGAFMIGTLGLAPWVYVPYCFLNILCPIISMIYGFTGFTIVERKKS